MVLAFSSVSVKYLTSLHAVQLVKLGLLLASYREDS
jgi:hypothetical protein